MFSTTEEKRATEHAKGLAASLDKVAPPETLTQMQAIENELLRWTEEFNAGRVSAEAYADAMDRLTTAKAATSAAKVGAGLQTAAGAIRDPVSAIGAAGGPVGSGVVAMLKALSDMENTAEAVRAFVDGIVKGLPDAAPALVRELAYGAPAIAMSILSLLADPSFWLDVIEAFAEGIAEAFGLAGGDGEFTSTGAAGGSKTVATVKLEGEGPIESQSNEPVYLRSMGATGRSRMTGRGGRLYLEIDADSVSDSFRQLAGRGYAWS
jgi:hypothetical protein